MNGESIVPEDFSRQRKKAVDRLRTIRNLPSTFRVTVKGPMNGRPLEIVRDKLITSWYDEACGVPQIVLRKPKIRSGARHLRDRYSSGLERDRSQRPMRAHATLDLVDDNVPNPPLQPNKLKGISTASRRNRWFRDSTQSSDENAWMRLLRLRAYGRSDSRGSSRCNHEDTPFR